MLRTKVPNDIRKYKTKLAGPFTLKQLITVTGLIILDLAVYSFVQPFNTQATATAQAPVPQAQVSPLPRSHTRIFRV